MWYHLLFVLLATVPLCECVTAGGMHLAKRVVTWHDILQELKKSTNNLKKEMKSALNLKSADMSHISNLKKEENPWKVEEISEDMMSLEEDIYTLNDIYAEVYEKDDGKSSPNKI